MWGPDGRAMQKQPRVPRGPSGVCLCCSLAHQGTTKRKEDSDDVISFFFFHCVLLVKFCTESSLLGVEQENGLFASWPNAEEWLSSAAV